eukprot:6904802-Lingulodinium_polyedra.AAC.1
MPSALLPLRAGAVLEGGRQEAGSPPQQVVESGPVGRLVVGSEGADGRRAQGPHPRIRVGQQHKGEAKAGTVLKAVAQVLPKGLTYSVVRHGRGRVKGHEDGRRFGVRGSDHDPA